MVKLEDHYEESGREVNMTVSTADAKVSDALVEEIDSIKVDTKTEDGSKVTYAPQAWTREGRVD
jgi:hypothetical protein